MDENFSTRLSLIPILVVTDQTFHNFKASTNNESIHEFNIRVA